MPTIPLESTSLTRRALLALALACSGCGTILHPERRGQPAGRLDWGVVALDTLGLIFFFVPGVIAFAVDFATGAIYLPPDDYYGHAPPPGQGQLVAIHTGHPRPQLAQVETALQQHTGRAILLTPGSYLSEPLKSLKDFWKSHAKFDKSGK